MADGSTQLALDNLYAKLKRETANQVCLDCGSRVWPAWNRTTWQIRCLKGFDPVPAKRPNYIQEKLGKLMTNRDDNLRDLFPDNQGGDSLPAVQNRQIAIVPQPMTIAEFDDRQRLFQHVADSMELGVHYGIVAGTSKSLWEPGAEYLRAAFNIQWSYHVILQEENFETGDFKYRFAAYQMLGPSVEGPAWEGFAWSKEKKFWCRAGQSGCPNDCDKAHTPAMELEMLPHNVRDRALKRAFVALIRNVTGATGYFNQAEDHQPESSAEVLQQRPTGQTGRPSGAAPLPDLGRCLEHGVPWKVQERFGRIDAGHPTDGGTYCTVAAVYKRFLGTAWRLTHDGELVESDVNTWLKNQFDGKTWSKMSAPEQIRAVTLATPPPEQPESSGDKPPPVEVSNPSDSREAPGNVAQVATEGQPPMTAQENQAMDQEIAQEQAAADPPF